jgi:hypothetical protein
LQRQSHHLCPQANDTRMELWQPSDHQDVRILTRRVSH